MVKRKSIGRCEKKWVQSELVAFGCLTLVFEQFRSIMGCGYGWWNAPGIWSSKVILALLCHYVIVTPKS